MNTYKYKFSAICPRNKERVAYKLTIETFEVILVEDIVEFVEKLGDDYHEPIADALFDRFGANQTLKAHHHGVNVRTTRP